MAENIRVISERTIDGKTIKLTADRDAIEVGVSQAAGNALTTKDDGLFVEDAGLEAGDTLVDLAGNVLGKLLFV